MTADRWVRIRDLCDAWRAAATSTGSGITIRAGMDQHRLWANGLLPHGFTYDELRAAAVGLTGNLLFPGLNAVIDRDHSLLWGWSAELILRDGIFRDDEHEVRELLTTAFRAALSGLRPWDEAGRRRQGDVRRQLEVNEQELLIRSHTVLVYLAFPALEAIAKKATGAFLTYDGQVQQPFSTPWRPYKAGERCSRVRDQLALLHGQVAGPSLRADLDDLRAQLTKISPGQDPFQLIDNWRNESLHGEGMLQTIGGTLLSVISLVALDMLKDRYAELQEEAGRRTEWQLRNEKSLSDFPPWAFYAPVLWTIPQVASAPPLVPPDE